MRYNLIALLVYTSILLCISCKEPTEPSKIESLGLDQYNSYEIGIANLDILFRHYYRWSDFSGSSITDTTYFVSSYRLSFSVVDTLPFVKSDTNVFTKLIGFFGFQYTRLIFKLNDDFSEFVYISFIKNTPYYFSTSSGHETQILEFKNVPFTVNPDKSLSFKIYQPTIQSMITTVSYEKYANGGHGQYSEESKDYVAKILDYTDRTYISMKLYKK